MRPEMSRPGESVDDQADQSKQLRERAAEHFLASAKLNPSDGVAFRFLGHYYRTVSVDAQRSAKCYQRAVALDPHDSEAGEALCDLLDGEGKESLEIAVCREASEKSPRAFWAFQRLGYLQALGLAYHRLGMFTAAVKVCLSDVAEVFLPTRMRSHHLVAIDEEETTSKRKRVATDWDRRGRAALDLQVLPLLSLLPILPRLIS
ncbi:hypothetical protein BHM03_00050746 [Ensete ventricosum]|nr:hypothetical protein BHM03_00050746 [Ensete ventricosum]